MSSKANTTIRMFGALHTIRKDRGLATEAEVTVPQGGCAASAIARELELPFDKIEAVFVNRKVYALDHVVQPGDRVAFIPTGIPGSARLLLGIDSAGQSAKSIS
ncbi:MAG TPA: hypothetical protein DCZ75_03340 [Geobacter sp.]|nr:hypothetical protein [Geobacter sp.]